jgi:hypothetical protein
MINYKKKYLKYKLKYEKILGGLNMNDYLLKEQAITMTDIELQKLCNTNKKFSELCRNEEIWKQRLSYHFKINKNLKSKTYKETYIIFYKYYNDIEKFKEAVTLFEDFNLKEFIVKYIKEGINKNLIFDIVFEIFYNERYDERYNEILVDVIKDDFEDDNYFNRFDKLEKMRELIIKKRNNTGFPGLSDLLDILNELLDDLGPYEDED